jgi:hypothetical protein
MKKAISPLTVWPRAVNGYLSVGIACSLGIVLVEQRADAQQDQQQEVASRLQQARLDLDRGWPLCPSTPLPHRTSL